MKLGSARILRAAFGILLDQPVVAYTRVLATRYRELRAKSERYAENFAGVYGDLVLNSRMSRGALVFALGLLGVCFPLAAQQAKHPGSARRGLAASAVTPLDGISNLSICRPQILNESNGSLLLHNGPVRAWSDGAQLISESALVQIGMAPLGLFPVAYLAPSDVGSVPVRKPSPGSNSRLENLATDGKDLSSEMISSPLNQVYYTGEVGFVYGQWSGKGSGDYVGSYVWGQAGNDKFQITAGASFDNWSGNGAKFRSFNLAR